MSCIFFNPFTSKNSFALITWLTGALFFLNMSAQANDMKITGHYYVANDKTFEKYTDKIQWEITNISEWSKFLTNLKTMPKDLEKNNPMGLKQPELIHFKVSNTDLKTGHDIFISKAGIQQFSKMPVDTYFNYDASFREFLDTELTLNPGYDQVVGEININQPGIVVVYRGSKNLKNPYWVINPSDTKVIERYKHFIKNLKKIPVVSQEQLSLRNESLDEENTFIVYLNYNEAPFDFLIMSSDSTSRSTKVSSEYFYYKDTYGYFTIFKRQAEDNIKGATASDQIQPEEIRKRQVKSGAIF